MLTMPRPVVELVPMCSMVAWIIFSDVLSSALVASSRNSKEAFFRSARAMAMRCFWPPENWEPPEPTNVSCLSGRASTNVRIASLQA
mmetsp:Transcript_32662/g.52567  ORF Transcript_32662/g.52567 Transcript_32662/m.52567 type:complete len:87 (+) Transcript_32662:2477-2737(+)